MPGIGVEEVEAGEVVGAVGRLHRDAFRREPGIAAAARGAIGAASAKSMRGEVRDCGSRMHPLSLSIVRIMRLHECGSIVAQAFRIIARQGRDPCQGHERSLAAQQAIRRRQCGPGRVPEPAGLALSRRRNSSPTRPSGCSGRRGRWSAMSTTSRSRATITPSISSTRRSSSSAATTAWCARSTMSAGIAPRGWSTGRPGIATCG